MDFVSLGLLPFALFALLGAGTALAIFAVVFTLPGAAAFTAAFDCVSFLSSFFASAFFAGAFAGAAFFAGLASFVAPCARPAFVGFAVPVAFLALAFLSCLVTNTSRAKESRAGQRGVSGQCGARSRRRRQHRSRWHREHERDQDHR